MKQRNSFFFTAVSYRISRPVTKILLLPSGDSHPICPRCDITMDREYMRFCDRCGQHLGWNLFRFASVIYPPYP